MTQISGSHNQQHTLTCDTEIQTSRPARHLRRAVAKAISYRLFGMVTTSVVALLVTGRPDVALGIGLADAAAKICPFVLHEYVWEIAWTNRKIARTDGELVC